MFTILLGCLFAVCVLDERILLSFIRGCKHDLVRTKSKLDMYFTMRAEAPELFADRDPLGEDVQGMFRVM